MKQEYKELLLKDLCARLPYGVKCENYNHIDGRNVFKVTDIRDNGYICGTVNNHYCWAIFDPLELKPYLFPLSSLTEEQRNYISKLLIDTQNEFPPYGELNTKGCDNLFVCSVKQSNALINYCLANHLDINGLIEKGLAIDATGLDIY